MKQLCTLLLPLCLFACQKPDLKAEKEALLQINEEQREAHMTNDARLLVASMADSLITVDGGNIYVNSREAVFERFKNYFQSVTYFKWDDLQAPIIHLSPAGDHATISVRKEVVAESTQAPRDTTIFAWTSAYRKVAGSWKMYSISSTDDQ